MFCHNFKTYRNESKNGSLDKTLTFTPNSLGGKGQINIRIDDKTYTR